MEELNTGLLLGALAVLIIILLVLGIFGFNPWLFGIIGILVVILAFRFSIKARNVQAQTQGQTTQPTQQRREFAENPVARILFIPIGIGVILLLWRLFLVPLISNTFGVSSPIARFFSGFVFFTPLPAALVTLFALILGFKSDPDQFKAVFSGIGLLILFFSGAEVFSSWTGKKVGEIPSGIREWGENIQKRIPQSPQLNVKPELELQLNAGEEKRAVDVGPGIAYKIWVNKPVIIYGIAVDDGSKGTEFQISGWDDWGGDTRKGFLVVRAKEDGTIIKFFRK